MNLVILTGRLVKDPDVKALQSTMFAVFTLAVDRRVKSGEEKQADFITCKAFGKTAELCGDWLAKGRKVTVNGSWRSGSYTASDGAKKYTNECVINEIDFGERPRGEQAAPVKQPDFNEGHIPGNYVDFEEDIFADE